MKLWKVRQAYIRLTGLRGRMVPAVTFTLRWKRWRLHFKKRVQKEGAADLLRAFREELAGLDPFTAESTEACMNAFCESREIGLGQVIHAVRVGVTGKGKGVGMFEALAVLGKDRCLARIDRALSKV